MFKKGSKSKKIASVISVIITAMIVVLTVYIIANIVIAKKEDRPVEIFGYSSAIVLSGSMEPEINKGDLIVFTKAEIEDLKIGDDVVFVAGSGFYSLQGENIVHRVVALVTKEGNILYEMPEDMQGIEVVAVKTKGVANNTADSDNVTADNLLGTCVYNSAFLGGLIIFFVNYGIFVLIFVVAVPIIIKQAIKIYKIAKQAKQEENNDKEE
jgi:signal peptidase